MINIIDDFFIDENGTVLKSGKAVPVLKDKDGYKYVYIYINGKRWQRYLAKLVAFYLVENPYNYKFTIFIDGDKNNCNPKNIVWISNKQDAAKRKVYNKWKAKKIENTKEEAIEKTKCPILKKYYETGDLSIINEFVNKIYFEVGKSVQKSMGWTYLYILERLERNSIHGDLKGYFIKHSQFFKVAEVVRNPLDCDIDLLNFKI